MKLKLKNSDTDLPQVQRLLSPQGEAQVESTSRRITYVFSDETVARDGHTILSQGWQLDNFKANPVFLWCHDSSSPPIGKVVDVQISGKRLLGTVEYADADTYEFADTIYRLTEKGFLNAVSVSWQPLEWRWSKDKDRPGGMDFLRQELLEVSSVPVPALPTALATARAAGIDTKPLYEWAEKILDSGDKILIPRDELETLRREADPKARTTASIKTLDEKTDILKNKRSLGDVSFLASILSDLGYLKDWIDWDAEMEGDESTISAKLLEGMKSLGQTLIDMTVEEVTELLSDADGESSRSALCLMASFRKLDIGALASMARAAKAHLDGELVTFTRSKSPIEEALVRAGKSLSDKNKSSLEEIHKQSSGLTANLRSFIDDNSPEDENPEDPINDLDIDLDNEERSAKAALRLRVATAARARHQFESEN